jgi:hypothetical protein
MFRRRKETRLLEEQHLQQASELQQMLQRLTTPDGDIPLDGFHEFVEFVGSRGIELESMPDIAKQVSVRAGPWRRLLGDGDDTLAQEG